jgi:hypothetical protein
MPVTKFKPVKTPRMLETLVQDAHEHTNKTVQRSLAAVARSRELIKKTKAVIAAVRRRKAG